MKYLELVPIAFAQGPGYLGCAIPTVGVQSPFHELVGSDLNVQRVKAAAVIDGKDGLQA